MKRLFDMLFSAVALLAALPLLLLIGVAVVLDSGFPVFFSQLRVGRDFQIFSLWKFRTMRASASGPAVTAEGDARVTRVGRLLRKSKLDELPQFWNVLRGEMSIVGPRPEVPEFVAIYTERYRKVLSVRPGITDFASICFRNEEAILGKSLDPLRSYREHILPVKLDLAEYYVQTQSMAGDLNIIAKTLMVSLCPSRSKGA